MGCALQRTRSDFSPYGFSAKRWSFALDRFSREHFLNMHTYSSQLGYFRSCARQLIWLIFALGLSPMPASAAGSIPTSDQVDYVERYWDIASDGSDAIGYFGEKLGMSYNGIPYSDYVKIFVVSLRVGEQLDSGNYEDAAGTLVSYAGGLALDEGLKTIGATGLVGVAAFSAGVIDYSLNLFVRAVSRKTFNEQCHFYFVARSQLRMTHAEILSHPNSRDDILFDDTGWIYALPDQNLSRRAGTPLLFVSPATFFAEAKKLYDAHEVRSLLAFDEREVRESFRRQIQPAGPTVTSDIADQSVVAGQAATFTIAATGSAPLTYLWYYEGVLVTPATGPSFTATASGLYRVVVRDANGRSAQSRIAMLTVTPAGESSVALTAPLGNASVSGSPTVRASAMGATKVEFWLDGLRQATATSAPFTWTWNTKATANGSRSLTAKAYNGSTLVGTSGATVVTVNNASLPSADIDSFEPNDSSTTATVLNFGQTAEGRISSSTDVDWFKIQVSAPGILNFNLGIPPGVDYDIELYGGANPVFLAGSYNGLGLGESLTYHAATAGSYYVRIYGYPFGSGSFSATFAYALTATTTSGAITLTTPPQNQSAPVGGTTVFSVAATSLTNSPLSYQWLRNGSDIAGATNAFYVTPAVSAGQNGDQFAVRVTSEFAAVSSNTVSLSVTNPTSIFWTGAVSSNWNTAGNWDLNRVPLGTDVVRITSGTVSTDSLYGVAVIISGGSVTLTGHLAGNVTVAAGGTLVIDNNTTHNLNGTLTNYGTVVWKDGAINGYFWGSNQPSAIINQSGGVFEIQVAGNKSLAAAQSVEALSFTNAGTLRRTVSTNDAYISCAFTNTGTVVAQTGTLYFNGGSVTNTGVLNASSGALLNVANGGTLQSGTVLGGGGTVRFGGAVTIGSGVTLSGAGTTVVNGTVTGTILGTGIVLEYLSGTCTVAGSVTLTGHLAGNVTVAAGGTLVIDNNTTHNLNGTLTNYGTVVWKDGAINGYFWGSNQPSAIINQSGGVFEIQVAGNKSLAAAQSVEALSFTNAGTLRRTVSTNDAYISCAFTNTGTVVAQTGTLYFNGGSVTNTGVLNASSGALLNVANGGTLQSGTVLGGGGTVRFGGAVTIGSGVTLSGAGTTVVNGTVTGTILGTGIVLEYLSGTCTVAGSVTLTGHLAGNVTVAAGGTLVIDNNTTHNLNGTLTNYGTVVWKDGAINGYFWGSNQPSAIINQSGGVFEIQVAGNKSLAAAQSVEALSFTNAGTLRRTVSTNDAYISCAFTNTGTVVAQTGTLYFNGGSFTNTGVLNASSGALLNVANGGTLQSGTVLGGGGTVRFGGAVTIGSGVTLSGAGTTVVNGTVTGTILGTGIVLEYLSGTCTVAGSVTLTGHLAGNVTVAAGGTLVIDNNTTHNLNGTLTNYGTVVWKDGAINGYFWGSNQPSAIINQSGGVFEIQVAGNKSLAAAQSVEALSFTNAGTLRRTVSTNDAYISCAFTNTGTVVAQTGTLYFNGGSFTNTGVLNASSGALLNVANGGTLQSGTVLGGGGTVRFGGAVTIGSGVTLSGAGTTVVNGTVTGTILGTGIVLEYLSGTCTVAGSVTLTGHLAGNVTVAAGGTLVIDNNTTHNLNGTLTNYGTVVWKDGAINGYFWGSNQPSAIINQSGGVFEIQVAGNKSLAAAQSVEALSFTNAGTLRRTVSTNDAYISCAFTNTGTVVAQTGTLYFNGGSFTQTDGLTQPSGGAVSFTTMNLVGGSLTGAGTINGNIVNTGGVVAPGGDQIGVLTLNGSYTQGPGGSLLLQLGGTQAGTGFDRLAVSGSATLDGTLTYALLPGYTPPAGASYAVLSFASHTGDFATYMGPTTASGFPFGPQVSNQGITLVVGSSLGITSQPVAQTTNAGTGVTFTVAANGSPAPSYLWQRKPNGQSTFSTLSNGGSYSGVTTATLAVAAPTLAMSGDTFRCVVSNGASPDVTSIGVVLTVVLPPTITSAASATFTVGQAGSFTVTATGTPAPTFSVASGRFPSWAAFNAATGVINGVPTSAAGSPFSFTIQAANGATPVTTQGFTLTVVLPAAAPLFITQPQTQLAAVGATVTLSVAATGNPAPTYLWKKNTLAMPGQTNASLVLANVQSIDAGSYTVVATNASGTATSNAAVLTVATPPTIATHPQSQTVAPAQGFALTVGGVGTAPFTYQWSKDGTAIGGATTVNYAVASTTEAHQGSYRVTVTNGVGSAVSNAADIALIPAGTLATHAVVGSGYTAGTTLTIANSITYSGTAEALGWEVLLPDGWTLASDGGSVGETRPAAGQTGLLDWAWTTVPVSPVMFSYTVNVPARATGGQQLAALVSLRQGGPGFQILAKPDPLVVNPVTAHSADTDRNFRIGLIELTRVIELYNTRNGTTRTGAYVVQANTEDGFAPDPARTGAAVVTLTAYHSADTARGATVRDARIDLVELTRVIELYNTRSGTVRTGAYHVLLGTEDGFEPGL
jgi:hypothetical protein